MYNVNAARSCVGFGYHYVPYSHPHRQREHHDSKAKENDGIPRGSCIYGNAWILTTMYFTLYTNNFAGLQLPLNSSGSPATKTMIPTTSHPL